MVMDGRKATTMPMPATKPSSATPVYSVGRKEKNPTAVAAAASASGTPTVRPVWHSAWPRSG